MTPRPEVPLPILIISELVGIPEDDRERVKRWCDDFSIVALNFYANISSKQLARGLQSVTECRTYLEAQVAECHSAPREDLLSALVRVRRHPDRRGQLVLAVLAAANRDPAHFPDPDRFDVARHPNFHLAFGHGHHHCVGAELARLEARMAFTILLTELGTLELLPTDLRHRENFNMRCYQTLPIRLSA